MCPKAPRVEGPGDSMLCPTADHGQTTDSADEDADSWALPSEALEALGAGDQESAF